ncbi:hypothetical protein HGM15179_007788 [Zosterops borbonicus]|uniref:Uncharacterized protein n=1 Tax=Zosterops borbonicus TaxID=364589 RepID=A0A8K1LM49_9PASS|nr:hypothetical protein HGM15179_007788 [Zosterops borbonicus]
MAPLLSSQERREVGMAPLLSLQERREVGMAPLLSPQERREVGMAPLLSLQERSVVAVAPPFPSGAPCGGNGPFPPLRSGVRREWAPVRYDNRDQLPKEPACSGFGNVRIVTVKEEQKVPGDYTLTRTDDALAIL